MTDGHWGDIRLLLRFEPLFPVPKNISDLPIFQTASVSSRRPASKQGGIDYGANSWPWIFITQSFPAPLFFFVSPHIKNQSPPCHPESHKVSRVTPQPEL